MSFHGVDFHEESRPHDAPVPIRRLLAVSESKADLQTSTRLTIDT